MAQPWTPRELVSPTCGSRARGPRPRGGGGEMRTPEHCGDGGPRHADGHGRDPPKARRSPLARAWGPSMAMARGRLGSAASRSTSFARSARAPRLSGTSAPGRRPGGSPPAPWTKRSTTPTVVPTCVNPRRLQGPPTPRSGPPETLRVAGIETLCGFCVKSTCMGEQIERREG